MPGTSETDISAQNSEPPKANSEPEKPTNSDEQVDLDGDNDPEEEEVEYEEIEVEEEVEEEEEEEEVEEEEEEEVEEESGEDEMKVADTKDDVEKKKHAELLALPPHGSEVYIGGIPPNVSDQDLKVFCQSVGEVSEVRVMPGKVGGEGKCYAFVTFMTRELASKAIEELNNTEFKGKKIKCSTTQSKHRLFIGNIPKNWTVEDMKKVVAEVGPGVNSVELLKDPINSDRNRGFAFVEYHNHACAEYSRQKMSFSDFKLDKNTPTVSWADPRNSESSSSQVKAVYVKNLPEDITQNRLKDLFEHHGEITKVVLPPAKAGHEKSRFGFVHFADRSSAMKALESNEKYEIDGQTLECSLAKPQADQKSSNASNHSQNSVVLPNYPPHLGFGMVGGPFGAVGAGYAAAGYAPPLMYGGGATPGGMAMMPMLLPDGRIAYVMQQPGLQQPGLQQPILQQPGMQQRGLREPAHSPVSRHGRSNGGSSSGGKHSYDNNNYNRGHGRYNPY